MYANGVHDEMSVRPSAYLGWTRLDRIHIMFCIWLTLCCIFASCLKLSVRPSAHLGRTGLDLIHVFFHADALCDVQAFHQRQ